MVFRILFLIFLLVSCTGNRFQNRRTTFRSPDVKGQRSSDHIPLNQRCLSLQECVDACHRVYHNTAEINQCIDLPIIDVEDLYKVAVYLEKPFYRDLKTIRDSDLEILLSIGTEPLNRYIERYTISESKRVLTWIAEEKHIARVLFALGPRKYRLILLNLFRSTDPLVAEEALHRNISKGDNFYKICNDRNNDYAIYMAHQVIVEDLCETRLDYISLDLYELREACIIRVYCHNTNGKYIHANDFKYISHVIEYDDIFDYIQEEDLSIGLNIDQDELTPRVCDRVCSFFPGSCS